MERRTNFFNKETPGGRLLSALLVAARSKTKLRQLTEEEEQVANQVARFITNRVGSGIFIDNEHRDLAVAMLELLLGKNHFLVRVARALARAKNFVGWQEVAAFGPFWAEARPAPLEVLLEKIEGVIESSKDELQKASLREKWRKDLVVLRRFAAQQRNYWRRKQPNSNSTSEVTTAAATGTSANNQ